MIPRPATGVCDGGHLPHKIFLTDSRGGTCACTHTVHHKFADFQSLKAQDSAPATTMLLLQLGCYRLKLCCCKIAEAEAAVSVNEKKWLVMHMHVQLKLDELRGRPTLGSL
jgi:hypothetical protein